jgi:hypothetical protein
MVEINKKIYWKLIVTSQPWLYLIYSSVISQGGMNVRSSLFRLFLAGPGGLVEVVLIYSSYWGSDYNLG